MLLRVLCAAAAGAVLLGGCTAEPAVPVSAPAAVTPSAEPSRPACAPPAPSAFPPLPAGFPADFPAPAGASDAVADDSDPSVLQVTFPSPLPLDEATRFVVDGLPSAGFEIVGGDREPHEADIVFGRGALQGKLRIAAVDDCTTFWLLQVVRPAP